MEFFVCSLISLENTSTARGREGRFSYSRRLKPETSFLIAERQALSDADSVPSIYMTITRYFTPDDANQMLPLVRSIVRDILEKGDVLRALGTEGRGVSPRFQKTMADIQTLIGELEALGCAYKDVGFQMGLVDFPALINGQEIFLCWRSDEETVVHYHRRDEGFAARRSIPPNWYLGGARPLSLA